MLTDNVSWPGAVIHSDTLVRVSQATRGSLEAIIDELGKRSATAQGLGSIITTVRRMMHTDQRLYVIRNERSVLGILKVGKKKLFIRDNTSGKMNELEPLCVLDFYVHESMQRSGVGKEVFEYMLAKERSQPHMLGYDRPSPKLVGFLRKHYNLSDYDPQANNFVVFKNYFRSQAPGRNPESNINGHGSSIAPEMGHSVFQRPLSACRGRRANQTPPQEQMQDAQGPTHARGRRSWWNEANCKQPELSDNFFLGGSAAPRQGGRRTELVSAPAGLHNIYDKSLQQHQQQEGSQRGGNGWSENELQHRGERGILQQGEDALSSFRHAGGGRAGGAVEFPQIARAGVRDVGRRDMNDDVGADSLQEKASSAFISRANAANARGAVPNQQHVHKGDHNILGAGSGGTDMWQRSNAQYGMHSVKQQQQQQERPQNMQLAQGQGHAVGSRGMSGRNGEEFIGGANVSGASIGGVVDKYNPYEHFVVGGNERHAALATSARNDRRLGNRLW